MREIKFREWDPIRQEAYGKYGLSYGDREDYDDMIAFRFSHTEYMGEDLIKDRVIEQYTGLKDKNGVEIYEGDVLELQDECWQDRTNIIGTVQYEAPRYTFISVPSAVWCSIPQNVKVISNIHDNPELLEEK